MLAVASERRVTTRRPPGEQRPRKHPTGQEAFSSQPPSLSAARAAQDDGHTWLVKASVGGTTPAASDYSDTLTFIATGTF